MIENIIGKGENAGYQHFLLSLQRFHKASSGSFSNTFFGNGFIQLTRETYTCINIHVDRALAFIFKKYQLFQKQYETAILAYGAFVPHPFLS